MSNFRLGEDLDLKEGALTQTITGSSFLISLLFYFEFIKENWYLFW